MFTNRSRQSMVRQCVNRAGIVEVVDGNRVARTVVGPERLVGGNDYVVRNVALEENAVQNQELRNPSSVRVAAADLAVLMEFAVHLISVQIAPVYSVVVKFAVDLSSVRLVEIAVDFD